MSSLIFTKSTSTKKLTFFDQKHGLTLLKKIDFLNFKNSVFYSKKGFFPLQSHQEFFLVFCFFLSIVNKEKISYVWLKA